MMFNYNMNKLGMWDFYPTLPRLELSTCFVSSARRFWQCRIYIPGSLIQIHTPVDPHYLRMQVMVNLAPGPNPCINQPKLSKLWRIWLLVPTRALINPHYPSYGESGPWFQSMHQSTQITIRMQVMVNLAPSPNPCINQPTLSKLWWIWPLVPTHALINPHYPS